jgi:hypothetical protein
LDTSLVLTILVPWLFHSAALARIKKKQRPEVTKATEKELGLDGGRFFAGQLGFRARKTRIGESIAQRSRRSQRED